MYVFWGVSQIVIFLAYFNPWRSARLFTLSNVSITSKDQLLFLNRYCKLPIKILLLKLQFIS